MATTTKQDELPHLTTKQETWVHEYFVNGGNALAAARAAGYSETCLARVSHNNTKNCKIQAHLAAKAAPTLAKYKITEERVAEEMAAIAFTNLDDVMMFGPDGGQINDAEGRDEMARRAIKEVTINETVKVTHREDELDEEVIHRRITIKLFDKKGALDSIAGWKGMKHDEAKGDTVIEVNLANYIKNSG